MEILPFVTTWVDPEGIMLSGISQTEWQLLYDITYMWNLKKAEFIETESRIVVARVWGMGEIGRCWLKVHISSYKMIKLWGPNLQIGDYS